MNVIKIKLIKTYVNVCRPHGTFIWTHFCEDFSQNAWDNANLSFSRFFKQSHCMSLSRTCLAIHKVHAANSFKSWFYNRHSCLLKYLLIWMSIIKHSVKCSELLCEIRCMDLNFMFWDLLQCLMRLWKIRVWLYSDKYLHTIKSIHRQSKLTISKSWVLIGDKACFIVSFLRLGSFQWLKKRHIFMKLWLI